MNNKLLKILTTLSTIMLGAFFSAPTYSTDTPTDSADLSHPYQPQNQADAGQVIDLIARANVLREKTPAFVKEVKHALEKHKGALPAAYSITLAENIAEAQAIRSSLFQYALLHRNALYRVDDNTDNSELLNSILISMSAALALFDNSAFMQAQFSGERILQNKLNEAYPELGIEKDYYKDSVMRANTLTYRTTITDAIRFFDNNQENIAHHLVHADKNIHGLYAYIEESPARKQLGGETIFRQIADQLGALIKRSTTESIQQMGQLKFLTSKVVGNSLGAVRWRTGKFKNDQEFLTTLSATLQPGDILLEKTPFALTDKTIPGHFGHVAIYIGTVEQLRALGALNLNSVQSRITELETGHVVLEALRGGVALNTLEHFMNIDDIAVLRPSQLTNDEIKKSIGLALTHFGKRYDFNFDVNTTDTIVCSELIYAAYPQINFMTKRVFTSFTISPDDIAKLASGSPSDSLELTFFAHDGELIYKKGDDVTQAALYYQLLGL